MPVEYKGLMQVIDKFDKVRKGLGDELVRLTTKAVLYVHSTVPPYPPPPVGSTYRRTNTLGRQVHTEVRTVGAEVVGLIGSPTVYSPWVISKTKVPAGTGPQTRFHAGRWWTLQEVVNKAKPVVTEIFQNGIKAFLGG